MLTPKKHRPRVWDALTLGLGFTISKRIGIHNLNSRLTGFGFERGSRRDRSISMAFDILDQLSVGIVLVDRSAKVLFANAAARALSAVGEAVYVSSSLTCGPSARHLGELIRSALDDACVRVMCVPSAANGHSLTVLVSPMRGADGFRSDVCNAHSAEVLLMLWDPKQPPQVPAAWMMDGYGLTSAEARVALVASSGLSIPETAARLGISPNTVKTHLRRVYEKTGTARQAELSRLVAMIGLARDGNANVHLAPVIRLPCAANQFDGAVIGTPLNLD